MDKELSKEEFQAIEDILNKISKDELYEDFQEYIKRKFKNSWKEGKIPRL